MVVATKDTYMHYLSRHYIGKTHDYALMKSEFQPGKKWFEDFTVLIDLGYIGFEKDYKATKTVIPHKKTKNGILTETQKEENKEISRRRVLVEHSILGLKKYRYLTDRLRAHDYGLYDDVLGICAGLHNFNLKNKT